MAIGANSLNLLFKIGVDAGQTQAQLKAVTDQLKVGVEGMKGSVTELGSQFKIFGSFLEGLVAGGIQGFIEGVIKSATATADWVNELDRASQATSIEIRTLAQLEGAFKEAGGSLNSMIGTFDIFAGKLAQAREGNNNLINILEKYGIVSSDVTEATDQAFRALGSLTDQTEKARLAQELFGKGGARQILQFKDLKDGIKGVTEEYKGLGDAIDPKLVAAAQAYEKESKKLDATLVQNRAVIAGLVLPAWVEFNISIRKAMESLTNFKSLAEHANEALDKFKIGPGLPAAPERGLGGEVVTEAQAREATEAGIAARSLEAARKVKDEKIKIAKQTTAGITDADRELAAAQKELADQQKQTGDIIIQNMEDQLKGLNQAIADTFDISKIADFKFEMVNFARFMSDAIDGIVEELAKVPQAIPGGGKGIPGLPDKADVDAQLKEIHDSFGGFFSDLEKELENSGLLFSSFTDLAIKGLEGLIGALETTFRTFILTGQLGAQAFRTLTAALLAQLTIEAVHQVLKMHAKMVEETAAAAADLAAGDYAGFLLHSLAAGHYATAAIAWGAVGAGAAVAGVAIGATGGLGGGGAKSAAAGGGFGGETAPGTVTINQGGGATLGIVIAQHTAVLERIENKLSSMSPADVITVGAEQNPTAIGQANNEAARRDGSISREFLQISGLRTA